MTGSESSPSARWSYAASGHGPRRDRTSSGRSRTRGSTSRSWPTRCTTTTPIRSTSSSSPRGSSRPTRRERARRVRREHREFFDSFVADAREILELVLDKYVGHGPVELRPKMLPLPPLRDLGSPSELAARFGGGEKLREVLDRLGERVYDAA
ncbi:type I restriction-modification enzyme R subunit C-terminal domain-containing protein [Streptosporangium roseum]|uniref:type I restriction-modification enzyme R subunit C-terminal domain-containing protein n=1 Tax=Streptosporangium roseum TaxID=2001 RepID=UPI00332F18FF